MLRVLGSVVLALSALLVVTACAGSTPDPTPSATTQFDTDEEAFAAAEATYRAYVDALNQVDLSDPETFEAVYAWTTGDAQAADRENLTQMHAQSWSVDGMTRLIAVLGESHDAKAVGALVCLDVSEVGLVDGEGSSVVPIDRPDQSMYEVEFEPGKTTTGLLVSTIRMTEEQCGA